MRSANGLVIAAPRSGSGKTLVTLGLIAALRRRGLTVAPAKTGPDYIDTAILGQVADRPAMNLDPWAMSADAVRNLTYHHGDGADLLMVEGVMGLFDGAVDGRGSTADLAATLRLPVILVVDADKQGQSIAALVQGFARFRQDVEIAGVILNRVATTRHERLLLDALAPLGIPVLGALPRRDTLVVPERHLGLVLPGEIDGLTAIVDAAAEVIETYLDLNRLVALSVPVEHAETVKPSLPPLGQHVAIAKDKGFAFIYQHIVTSWKAAGAAVSFFSPLANESPAQESDAVFLPGGYPELHSQRIAAATSFHTGLKAARDRGALIYGECGGYMVLGETLTDASGTVHRMSGLLPIHTDISRPRRTLGYRRLQHTSPLPWPRDLMGHEFHYSAATTGASPLFTATDARGEPLPPMGMVVGRVMGSYAHVIDAA
jgi:cobyrinic acid a,c-diamide synthase